MSKSVTFNRMAVVIQSDEDGSLIDIQFGLDGEMVASSRKIIPGRPGSNILNSRLRKAVRTIIAGAFPKAEKPVEPAPEPLLADVPVTA